MEVKNRIFLFLIFMVVLFSACDKPSLSGYQEGHGREYQIRMGDDPSWANRDIDTSEWSLYEEVNGNGVYWFRVYTHFTEKVETLKEPGVMIGATGAYEVFFDGVFIGKNGRLKSEGVSEIQGEYIRYFSLPDSLMKKGKHVMAFRMTTDAKDIGIHAFYEVGEYVEMIREPFRLSLHMFILAGAFLITALYFFFIFLSQPKEYSVLIFTLICLLFCALLMMEYLKLYYSYPYSFQRTRLVIIGWLHIFLAFLVPLYFMIQFRFPWKRWAIPIMIGGIAYVGLRFDHSFDYAAFIQSILMWSYSGVIVAYGIYKKEKAAYIVMMALLANVLVIYILPKIYFSWLKDFDVTIFLGYLLLVISMLYVITIKRREEQRAYEASIVLSERLKNELLKKNIKPHFIMNTLTSLIDWVEESPKEGVQFINALANEFEVLNEIADYKQIPIEQEIKLCKSHLKVMGYRKEIDYVWEQNGIDLNDIIPPAIIHTAVENGVTHSLPNENGKITFRLNFERTKKFKKYTLQTIAKNRSSNKTELPKDIEGTGLKYIKSRLRESYQDDWTIESKANESGWITEVKIFRV